MNQEVDCHLLIDKRGRRINLRYQKQESLKRLFDGLQIERVNVRASVHLGSL